MSKGLIEVEDLEGTYDFLNQAIAELKLTYRHPDEALLKGLDNLASVVAKQISLSERENTWRPLKAGYRSVRWVKAFREGYAKEEEFPGLEISTLGEIRTTSTMMPPTVRWDGDPSKPIADYRHDEKFPEGKTSFFYKGRTWYLIIKKFGPLDPPTVWIVTEEQHKKGLDPILPSFY